MSIKLNISDGKMMLYFDSVFEIATNETITTEDDVPFNLSDYILADRTRRQYYEWYNSYHYLIEESKDTNNSVKNNREKHVFR